MFTKIKEIKDTVVTSLKNVTITRWLELGAGVALVIGGILIKAVSDEDISEMKIVENYDILDDNIDDVENDIEFSAESEE